MGSGLGRQDQDLNTLRRLFKDNPATADFVALALILAGDEATRSEGREVCFRGLTENPHNHRGRLALARLFYLDGYWEFAVRELLQLQREVKLASLDKLLESFGDIQTRIRGEKVVAEKSSDGMTGAVDSQNSTGTGVVAEIDLDADFVDALEELE